MTNSFTIREKVTPGCGTQIMSPSSPAPREAENKDAHDVVQNLTVLRLGITNHPALKETSNRVIHWLVVGLKQPGMPDLSTSQSLLLQQLHFIIKHWSRNRIICMCSTQRAKTGRPLSQYSVLWCGRLIFNLLPTFSSRLQMSIPNTVSVVSVSSWLSEYWIIYHNGLVSDSNTGFTPLLHSGLPSNPPILLNYQLSCLRAASYLC